MTRLFAIGLISLSLAGCAGLSTRPAIEYRYVEDLPDESLVTPCDTTEKAVEVNADLVDELNRTRRQRNDCAAQVDGVRQWRRDAAKRAADRNKQ